MTKIDPTRCRNSVWRGPPGWQEPEQCFRKAVTTAGYCKQHDPELAREREQKRPPNKWERARLAREELRKLIDQYMPPDVAAKAVNLLRDTWT